MNGIIEQALPRGKAVLLPTPSCEPHGAELSSSSCQPRSGGHQNAAGPCFSLWLRTPAAKEKRSRAGCIGAIMGFKLECWLLFDEELITRTRMKIFEKVSKNLPSEELERGDNYLCGGCRTPRLIFDELPSRSVREASAAEVLFISHSHPPHFL